MNVDDEYNDDNYNYYESTLKTTTEVILLMRLMAPFGVTIRMKKISYCNNNIIPLLKEKNIEWDMNEMRIKFCGQTFPMKYIDDGECERFISSLIDDGQSKLTLWNEP